MPKRRIVAGGMHRRTSRTSRAIRRDAPNSLERRARAADPLAPPLIEGTREAVVALDCASCDFGIRPGAMITLIDKRWNCAECTQEARRG